MSASDSEQGINKLQPKMVRQTWKLLLDLLNDNLIKRTIFSTINTETTPSHWHTISSKSEHLYSLILWKK